MTAFNMPPGCSPRDIPGNGPHDQDEEALANYVWDQLECKLPDEQIEAVYQWVSALRGAAYSEGYKAALADAALAAEYRELDGA